MTWADSHRSTRTHAAEGDGASDRGEDRVGQCDPDVIVEHSVRRVAAGVPWAGVRSSDERRRVGALCGSSRSRLGPSWLSDCRPGSSGVAVELANALACQCVLDAKEWIGREASSIDRVVGKLLNDNGTSSQQRTTSATDVQIENQRRDPVSPVHISTTH